MDNFYFILVVLALTLPYGVNGTTPTPDLITEIHAGGTEPTPSPKHRLPNTNGFQWPNYSTTPKLLRNEETTIDVGGLQDLEGLGNPNKQGEKAAAESMRYSTRRTTTYRRKRTTKEHVSLDEYCDYLAQNCLRAYQTGKVCGKTVYYYYFTFKNYCMMDYVNCRIGYQQFTVIHMGDCFWLKPFTQYYFESYGESDVMKGYYVYERDLGRA